VFRGILNCVKGDFEEPRIGGRYAIGWDIAKHSDFSVMMVIDIDRKHIVAYDRFNQIDYSLQIERLHRLATKYNAKVIMDSTGVADPVLEQVKLKGMQVEGFSFTNTTKQQLIEALAVAIENEEITYPHIDTLIHELQLYEYEITRAGNVRYNAPQGYHDDTVIALGLALYGCKMRLITTMSRKGWGI
jgi:phage FluMu gp28-like protein